MANPFKIRVEDVSKIFGPDPKAALAKVNAGMSKTDLLAQTGNILGLHDINLNIRAGETFVIMGLSGSGKSTLIRHFNRLIEPTAGRILVDDVDVLSLNEADLRAFRRKKISMVFQRFALLPHKTVMENVIYGPIIDGMPKAQAQSKGAEQITLVGLAGFEHHYPGQLSGGMQQRVGLARALATDAEILLMDEAFSALDPLIRHDMQLQLRDIQARLHKTIVFITHDLDEALLIGDHIAILKDGLLRQVGTGPEILVAPADDYVARFVRDVNRARIVTCGDLAAPGQGVGDTVLTTDQTIESAYGALASSDAPITVRHANGDLAGVLTRQRVFDALART
ncbi:MAG: glycine/betaine ABC transporter ATP-binding protein [Cereibacter sphaeroides]|uniref:Quaternary amine transport ATP-binding protein n=1 Tax=Cereibacter sphaeroides TaxID=1063 RepID=A0A2W5RZP3_CERSP|nr:MAG: glycine/betaine ABC transporter ATP-binding protein [Cereibacter sphaeroides]